MNKIEYLGQSLDVKSATLARGLDEQWTLVVIGEPIRVRALGSEICDPYIEIDGLDLKILLAGEEISWRNDITWANRTYFTMFGEGFGIFSGALKVECVHEADGRVQVVFRGETDFPSGNKGMDPVSFHVLAVCQSPNE